MIRPLGRKMSRGGEGSFLYCKMIFEKGCLILEGFFLAMGFIDVVTLMKSLRVESGKSPRNMH